jgi:hypothetical protein
MCPLTVVHFFFLRDSNKSFGGRLFGMVEFLSDFLLSSETILFAGVFIFNSAIVGFDSAVADNSA